MLIAVTCLLPKGGHKEMLNKLLKNINGQICVNFGYKSANLKMRLTPMFKGACTGDFLYYSTFLPR